MSETERKPELPTILVVVLALMGVSTVRSGLDRGASPAPIAPAESRQGKPGAGRTSSAATVSPDWDTEVLRPLAARFGAGSDKPLVPEDVYPLIERDGTDAGIRCLIATVPDPVGSTNSHRFDEHLDALQRGVETQGYLLDGYSIPWNDGESPPSAAIENGLDVQLQQDTRPWKVRLQPVVPPSERRKPGVVLLRNNTRHGDLLLLCLVPESPTLGLDKHCMSECLRLARVWDVRNRRDKEVERYNILGPRFSGGQPSLEQVLHTWVESRQPNSGRVAFEIITGTASAIDIDALKESVKPHDLSFRATVHRTEDVLRVLLDNVDPDEPVAILKESDTSFGQSRHKSEKKLIYYMFPSHISDLRSSYDKQGVFRDRETSSLRSAERLTVPFDVGKTARDVVEPETPEYTAAVEELTLDQILTDIARRDIHKVGIVATDPRDIIFLAREVNQFCHDVQLFTPINNLLFAHPQYAADLRGMYVGSTYLLYPPNQAWSDRDPKARRKTPHTFFGSNEAQGAYNAMVAQLLELGIPDSSPPRFLEYSFPFNRVPQLERSSLREGKHEPRVPPIWIGVVGNRGIFPVHAEIVRVPKVLTEDNKSYNYLYKNDSTITVNEPGAEARKGYQAQIGSFWTVLFAGLTFAGLLLVVMSVLAAYWHFEDRTHPASLRLGEDRFRRLAELLNCRRVGKRKALEGALRGPGPNLIIMLIILLSCYVQISYRLLRNAYYLQWGLEDTDYWIYGYAICAALTILALLFGLLFSALVWSLDWSPPARRLLLPGPRPYFGMLSRIVAVSGCLSLGLSIALVFITYVDPDWRDKVFMLECSLNVASGVSSVLPMSFLSLAGAALVFSRLRDLYLFDQCMPH